MTEKGFTVVEVAIIIVVVAILAGILFLTNQGVRARANDTDRKSYASLIARRLELSYRTQANSTGPSYPTATELTTNLSSYLAGQQRSTPQLGNDLSVIGASSTTTQTPTATQIIYQPFDSGGGLCATSPCVRFILYYLTESSEPPTTTMIQSMRQQ